MEYLVATILEKHAAGVSEWFKGLGPVKNYIKTKNSAAYKARHALGKTLGITALVGGPVAYGVHKLTKEPDISQNPQLQPAQPYSPY